jgi:hypothetical protein
MLARVFGEIKKKLWLKLGKAGSREFVAANVPACF